MKYIMNYTKDNQTVLKSNFIQWLINEFDYLNENDVKANLFINGKNNFLLFYAGGFNMFEIVNTTDDKITFKYVYSVDID